MLWTSSAHQPSAFIYNFTNIFACLERSSPASTFVLKVNYGHQKDAWNWLKVTNKDTTKTLMTPLWCLYCYDWADFTHCPGISLFDYEKVNTSWWFCSAAATIVSLI